MRAEGPERNTIQGALIMDMLHPLDGSQGQAAKIAMSGDGDGIMKADHASVQADVKFLRAILVGLAFTTCLLGTAAVMAMS